MKTIPLYDNGISDRQAIEIADMLRDGQVMVWPTDTFYGIACDIFNPKSVERLCRIKGVSPDKNIFSLICADISQASEYTRIGNEAFRLIRTNTPGPFTFILRANSKLPRALKGRKNIGIRIPAFSDARKIAETLGNPILSTSVRMDNTDIIAPELIAEQYQNIADIFLIGPESGTLPSTVIDCTTPDFTVLREGAGEVMV